MKKYEKPMVSVESLSMQDILTESPAELVKDVSKYWYTDNNTDVPDEF